MDFCFISPLLGLAGAMIARRVVSPLTNAAVGKRSSSASINPAEAVEATSAVRRRVPFRFQMIDLASLVFALGLAWAAYRNLELTDRWGWFDYSLRNRLFLLFSTLLAGSVWWIGVRALNAAEIHGPGRRAAFMLFAVPAACVGSALVSSLWIVGATSKDPLIATKLGFAYCAIFFVLIAAWRASKWVARGNDGGRN